MPNDPPDTKGGNVGMKTDDLLNKFFTLSGSFSKYHTNVDENRRFYERNFAGDVVPNPDSDDPIWTFLPPTARRAIDEPADHILYSPKVHVPIRPGRSDVTKREEQAEDKRMFVNTWFRTVEQLFNPLGDARKLMLNEGRVCIKQELRWDLIPDYPERKTGETIAAFKKRKRTFKAQMKKLGHYEFLWDVQLLDSKSVYEDPMNHRDPQYVYIRYTTTVEEAIRMFPKSKSPWTKGDDYSEVTFLDYWSKPKFGFDGTWTPGQHVQWIDEHRESDGKSPYPYIPVAIEDAGYGVNYRTAKPHEKFVGITQHVLDTLVAEARQMTSWENVTEMNAYAPMKTWNMDPTRRIKFGPHTTIPLQGAKDDPNAEDNEPLVLPGLPLEVIQLANRTTQIVDEAVKMNVLSGQPISGVETATEADQQIRNASAKLAGPVAGLERLATKMINWVLMDIDLVLESPVTVFGSGKEQADVGEITIGQKHINGFYKVSVELMTTDEDALNMTKARFWSEMYRVVPFLSAYTAMTKGDITDQPMNEMIQRSAEDVYLSEEMTAIRKLTGAQSFGEFAAMIKELVANGGETAGGAASDESLLAGGGDQATGPASATQQRIVTESLDNRDINQGASQIRA